MAVGLPPEEDSDEFNDIVWKGRYAGKHEWLRRLPPREIA